MKVVKSFEEQIDYLRNYKHINIDKNGELLLKKIGYVNLITPYKHFFHKGKNEKGYYIYEGRYRIQDYYAKYKVDIEETIKVREIVYSFEKNLKSFLCESISNRYEGFNVKCVNSGIIADIKLLKTKISRKPQANLKIEYLNDIIACFSRDAYYFLIVNKLNLSQLRTMLDIYRQRNNEVLYFIEYFNDIRILRNTLSHGDTVQMYLNRSNRYHYNTTIRCIKKMNKFNLCCKDIDYYLLSESYKKYNLTNDNN